jgi:hypothetical protein
MIDGEVAIPVSTLFLVVKRVYVVRSGGLPQKYQMAIATHIYGVGS